MRTYTRKGDGGMTDLADGTRASKSDGRIVACGAIDEACAAIGVAIAHAPEARSSEPLRIVQSDLFKIGAEIAGAPADAGVMIGDDAVKRVEREIDWYESHLEPLRRFVLPGGGLAAASLHAARATVRRAETHAVSLEPGAVRAECAAYLNRVSDLLFVMARHANAEEKRAELPWSRKDTLSSRILGHAPQCRGSSARESTRLKTELSRVQIPPPAPAITRDSGREHKESRRALLGNRRAKEV